MANITSGNPIIVDTEGIISTVPLRIQSILLKPNATGDAATFTYWLESDNTVTTHGDMKAKTVTVTASSGTFSSTANFETDNINVNQIVKVYSTSSAKNIGYWQIATNADDNTITVDLPAAVYGGKVATLENDTSGTYSWKVWDSRFFTIIRGSGIAGDTSLAHLPLGDYTGFFVPNLAMHTLSTSAVLYIYLKN
jgi:hypothetical protein